jgi:hypothetical protein
MIKTVHEITQPIEEFISKSNLSFDMKKELLEICGNMVMETVEISFDRMRKAAIRDSEENGRFS